MAKENWIRVEDALPDIEKEVLTYYEITPKKNENGGKPYRYTQVGYLYSVTTYKNSKQTEWRSGSDTITPTHWHPLPDPPTNK